MARFLSLDELFKGRQLAPPQTHQCCGSLDRDPAVCQIDHDTQPGQFLTAHLDHRHRTSPRTPRPTVYPSDISIGDAGDISIGDLQSLVSLEVLAQSSNSR
jgi:hypothetical protein